VRRTTRVRCASTEAMVREECSALSTALSPANITAAKGGADAKLPPASRVMEQVRAARCGRCLLRSRAS
jgi:hypothetical protein